MLVEISDPTLVERLKRLLPRPDLPLDVAIKSLLEKSAAWVAAAGALAELRAELRQIETELQALRGQIEELKRTAGCGAYIAVPLSALGGQASAEPKAEGIAEGKYAVLERLHAAGKRCFTYSELREVLGYRPSGPILRKLKKKISDGGTPLYCLP